MRDDYNIDRLTTIAKRLKEIVVQDVKSVHEDLMGSDLVEKYIHFQTVSQFMNQSSKSCYAIYSEGNVFQFNMNGHEIDSISAMFMNGYGYNIVYYDELFNSKTYYGKLYVTEGFPVETLVRYFRGFGVKIPDHIKILDSEMEEHYSDFNLNDIAKSVEERILKFFNIDDYTSIVFNNLSIKNQGKTNNIVCITNWSVELNNYTKYSMNMTTIIDNESKPIDSYINSCTRIESQNNSKTVLTTYDIKEKHI